MRRVLALLVVPAVLGLAAAAPAEEDLASLLREYEARLAKRDDAGYAAQREILFRVADAGGVMAKDALRTLLRQHGSDRRAAAAILAALVRRGRPADLDEALAWIEARHDGLLLEMADRVVAAAEDPETRAYARGTALAKAPPPLKAVLARGLGGLGDAEATVPLLLLLREPDLRVRVEALGALGMLKDPRATAPVGVFLRDADPRLREAAARSLGMLGDPRSLPGLHRALETESEPLVLESVATATSLLDRPESIPFLLDRLERSRGANVRLDDAFARALQRISGKEFGADASQWRAWWETVKARPFVRAAPDPAGTTVQGLRYYDFPVRSNRLVFVIDVSRSMGWNERLDTARNELTRVLESLPATTRFNVVSYSDASQAWSSGLVDAKPREVKRVTHYVESLKPDSGTNTWAALRLALQDPEADTIFFLSDGHPSVGDVVDPDLILAEVRNLNRYRRVRIHCVALVRGEPPAAFRTLEDPERAVDFMRRLAAENAGDLKIIR